MMAMRNGVLLVHAAKRGCAGIVSFLLCAVAGFWTPFPTEASVQLSGFGVVPLGPVHQTPAITGTPATPPATYNEPLPAADIYSDSVGATPATFRVDESGASTYAVPIYVPPGTAGLVPALSLEYNSRGANGPLGPGFTIGGLSAIARCKKATEYGDGAGPFPAINFDGVAADQAYCVDGSRLLDLAVGAGNCPAGPSGTTAHVFGLELDPSTRVCGYTKTGITGYAFWLVQPKDGSDRVYGVGGSSALPRNDGTSVDTTQYLSWALSRIADATGNTVEFSYSQTATSGEMDIARINYTGKIALSDVLVAAPTFTRSTYANVVFGYSTLPAASQRIDYIAGMKLALTQHLTSITVTGPANHSDSSGTTPTTAQVVRTYHLNYGTPTPSGLSALTSLQECVPNSSSEVCYPSTLFTWNFAGSHQDGFPNAASTSSYSGLQTSIDYKVGDVDGDGRQDLVWVKDHSCDGAIAPAFRFELMVSLATATGFAPAIGGGVFLNRPPQLGQTSLPACGADWRGYHFDTLWYLYDFSGDGLDDVLASNGSAWNIYPAVVQGAGGWSFDGVHPISTGMTSAPDDDGVFADFTGDGLPDLIHETNTTGIAMNVLQRASSGGLTFAFGTTATSLNMTLPTLAGTIGAYTLGFAPQPGRNFLSADLNGDGASDFVLKLTFDNGSCGAGGGGNLVHNTSNLTAQGLPYQFAPSSQPDATTANPCPKHWYTFRNNGIQSDGQLHFAYETDIGAINATTGNNLPADGSYISLVDLNGDGQADLVYARLDASSNYVYYSRLNAGKTGDASASERFLPEQAIGLSLTQSYSERVQFLDVNGDHRTDLLYQDGTDTSGGAYHLKALLWGATTPSGFSTPVEVGNSTLSVQNPATVQSFLIDVDGNGAPDLVRFAASGSSGTLSVYGNAVGFGGNDFLTGIVDGLGALTNVSYYPITYTSSYTRAFDGPAQTWGRGSAVFDVSSSLWVVHQATSSAPIGTNATAQSSVVYRYSGAKVQSGGRGFLGFKTVQAENQQPTQDTNSYLVTTTEYHQDFPFIGRPDHTVAELETALQSDPCNTTPGDLCFTHDPPPCGTGGVRCNAVTHVVHATSNVGVGGQVLSDAADTYVSNPTFNAGIAAPVMPYLSYSDEQKFDVTSAGSLSHEITSSFVEDTYGNVTSSSVISSENSGIDETKGTTNVYGCTLAPPTLAGCVGASLNTDWQRLGRLSISTITSDRPGQTTSTRRASFEYDSTTLQRVAEIQGPYDDLETATVRKTLGLRTDLIRDADGNVTEQVQCSTSHFASRSACTNLSAFQQRQFPADLTKIQRYAKFDYESLGRFMLDKKVPFYSATASGNVNESYAESSGFDISACGSSLQRLSTAAVNGLSALTSTCPFVVRRDAFGNPLDHLAANGDQSTFVFGSLGRAYFAENVTTGAFSRTSYTWCTDAASPGIPVGAPRANCPFGAAYRITVDSTASATSIYANQSVAPTSWAYFDVLGREVLSTKRLYQPDAPTPSTQHWSSVATTYDSTGRTATTSVPYFSIDPTSTQTGSNRAGKVLGGGAVALATATYDAADRAMKQTNPEEAVNSPSNSSWSYSTLTTNATNPRGYQSVQVKNARDEPVTVTDPGALQVHYYRDAVGGITNMQRTPTDGNSAGVTIATRMSYDRLGRKTGMTDPDKGIWSYSYNALGELIGQTDAKSQTQTLYRDALGRTYQRNETRLSGGSQVSEPTSIWEFDTATRSNITTINGMLHVESNVLGGTGFSRTMAYNNFGRVANVATNVDSYAYTEQQTYDQFGRPFQHFDPSTDPTSTNGELTLYSEEGMPIATQEAADSVNGVIYDQVLQLSVRGQVMQEEYHQNAGLITTRSYDANTGRVLGINTAAGTLQNWSYDYDKHSNLSVRWNQASGYNLKENLTYDSLDRLHTVALSANGGAMPTLTVGYDQLGNLMSKTAGSSTQNWTYASQPTGCAQVAGPHAVSVFGTAKYCYDANGNQTSANYGGSQARTIVYTGYDLPASITTNGTPSVATESFSYAPDRSMWKRSETATVSSDKIFCNGFDTSTNTCASGGNAATYFVGNIEARVSGSTTTFKRYIGGYLVVTTTIAGGTTGNPAYAYLFRDALGSLDIITNENAGVQQRLSFDAWGSRRDPSAAGGWGLLPTAAAASFDTGTTYQGFTGHQQLDPVGLIHMRGRLYDPSLGRFIQADPMTDADATQGLNRYSYVLNNPLSLTDPSGYLSFRQILGIAIAVVAACFGQYEISQGALGWAFATAVAGGFLSAYVSTGSLKAGLWGAFTGAVFFGIGAGFAQYEGEIGTGFAGSGFSTGAFAANVAAHAAAGGVLNTLQGGNFGNGFVTSGVTAAISPSIDEIDNAPVRVMTAALVGGTVSKATGGSFANGAETAALQSIFTTVARPANQPDVGSDSGERGVASVPDKITVGESGFLTPEEAAKAFGDKYYKQGVAEHAEYQTGIVRLGDNDFGYIVPGAGPQGASIVDPTPLYNAIKGAGYTVVAWDHTHWDSVMTFSGSDMYFVKDTKGTLFLTNAAGASYELNFSMLKSAALGTMGPNPIGTYINSTKNTQGKRIP